MRPGLPERRTHDYERHGTTTLFAALDLASGKVMEQTHRRHRAAEFKKFLEHVDQQVQAEFSVHLVLDNYSTHKTPEIKKWLLRHPSLRTPLHAHLLVVDQSHRALVRRADREVDTAWHTPIGARAGDIDPGVDQDLERGAATLRMDQVSRRDLRLPRLICSTNLRDSRLDLLDASGASIAADSGRHWPGMATRRQRVGRDRATQARHEISGVPEGRRDSRT